MKKIDVIVPEGIRYISDWEKMDNGFSLSKIEDPVYIINKQITGCGFTESCITNNLNVILLSPRKVLLENKESQHEGNLFYYSAAKEDLNFDKSLQNKNQNLRRYPRFAMPREEEAPEVSQNLQDAVLEQTRKVSEYYVKCSIQGKPCKIIVTYDSFRHVKEALGEAIKLFYIVVDEFQSIFTDSRFKGSTEMEVMAQLKGLDKVCFVSATPMLEKYLDMLDEFKDLPYYEFDWKTQGQERVTRPSLRVFQIDNITNTISKIIEQYRNGEYEEYQYYDQSGNLVTIQSKEAVFYVNSVTNICEIIKKNELTQEECNILCAKTDENEKKLKRAFGVNKNKLRGFGTVPRYGEPHKMFTLCTRTVYLGADFYSTCARSFIFSDANIECLAVDISLDLPQILGRQRLDCNPWKNCAEFYYKPLWSSNEVPEEAFNEFIEDKIKSTESLLRVYEATPVEDRKSLVGKYKRDLKENYKFDYVSIDKHAGSSMVPVFNSLVLIAERRAFDIQQVDYKDRFSVFSTLSTDFGVDMGLINKAVDTFNTLNNFMDRMRYICSLPREIVTNLFGYIPSEYINYYRILGPERILSMGIQRSKIVGEYNYQVGKQKGNSELIEKIRDTFKIGGRYINQDIKKVLQGIYDSLSINKRAVATDLNHFFEMKDITIMVTDEDTGKRVKKYGFEILSEL